MLPFRIIIVGVFLTLVSTVRAQTPTPKSPRVARSYSLVCTVVPTGIGAAMLQGGSVGQYTVGGLLVIGGVLFGPGAGHVYAEHEKPMEGALLRAIGLGFATAGASKSWWSHEKEDEKEGIAMLVVGGALCLLSTVGDIVSAGRSAEEYNRRHHLAAVWVTPWVPPGNPGIGCALQFKF